MIKHSYRLITIALLVAVAAVAISAGNVNSVTFDVPFDFQIRNTKYEKGKYRVTRENQNAVLIESLENSDSAFVIAGNSNQRLTSFDESQLTFYKYGDRYFLRVINSPSISASVTESKDEKALQRDGYEKLAKVNVGAMRTK